MRSMAVSPAARGLGAGRLLLQTVEEFAITSQTPRMYLSTTPFLAVAIRLYESSGFKRTGEPPDEIQGTPLITMAKLFV